MAFTAMYNKWKRIKGISDEHPNWQHHSKKEQKRTLKPQAMRARKEALRQLKKLSYEPAH